MGRYLQGAAFYLFVYFILGLINSGIMYFATKFLHVIPVITITFLMFLTVFVLFFAFKKSLELFILEDVKSVPQWKVVISWLFHFILFVSVASLVELKVLPALGNPKLIKVATVFSNLVIFFVFYWLVVKAFIEKKGGDLEA